jgi:hypothetical protein
MPGDVLAFPVESKYPVFTRSLKVHIPLMEEGSLHLPGVGVRVGTANGPEIVGYGWIVLSVSAAELTL